MFEQATTEWNLEQLYLDLSNAKEQVFPHKKTGLTSTEKLHIQGLLCGNSPTEIANLLVIKPQGLNVALSNTIYRYVEELTGHSLNSLENWREIVNWLEIAGYKTQSSTDWGEAPDITSFYGRTQELAQLQQWIAHDRSRLIALLGMGGIGKTALAVKLVEQIKDEFEIVMWRSLRDTPPLEALFKQLLQYFPNYRNSQINANMAQLLRVLRTYRCLIILDEVEVLLKEYPVGYYCDSYKGYSEFLRRVGTERHQSCVVVISREKPREFTLFESENYPVHSLLLGGLQEESSRGILKDQQLDEGKHWEKLVKLYWGNPLALKTVAAIIRDLFEGSVTQFLKQNTTLFISNEFFEILDQQFTRLSELEAATVCKLATYTHPISISELTEIVSQVKPQTDTIQIIDSLRRRSLLEKVKSSHEALFILHPIIVQYVIRFC
jgi:hypothetical protein